MCFLKKRSGHSFIEYAIFLGIVAVALFSMNIYIKRGVQNKTKEMADKFISNQQIGQVSPDTEVESNSVTGGPNDFNISRMTTSEGGGTRIDSTSIATYHLDSSEGESKQGQSMASIFVPWQSGTIENVDRGGTYDYNGQMDSDNEDEQYGWQSDTDIARLQEEKEKLLNQADELRANADTIRTRANDLGGLGDFLQLFNDLTGQADDMVNRAVGLEERAALIQARIDELQLVAGG